MARKKVEQKDDLKNLIPEYGKKNTECNSLKKVVSDLNTRIKKAIKDNKKSNEDIIVDGWVCKLAVKEKSTFNEDRLIEFCKKNKIDVVRTKEYVDADALEKLMFNGSISKELILEMDKCKDTSMDERLSCSKVKEN